MEIKYMFLMSCFMVSSTNTVSHGILEYSQGPLEFISATRFSVFYAHCLPLKFLGPPSLATLN